MTYLGLYLVLVAAVTSSVYGSCSYSDWTRSFDGPGLVKCDNNRAYMTGYYRSGLTNWGKDPIWLIEKGHCCPRTSTWYNQDVQSVTANWWATFDRNNNWNTCPRGYFLQGLYRSQNHKKRQRKGELYRIEEGRCVKPAKHPLSYGHCYDQDIGKCGDAAGTCKCKDGYFLTGLYRSSCHWLYCIEKLRCCKEASSPEKLNNEYNVKNRVMDVTLVKLAYLANALGYGWCSGCRGQYVGDDYYKSGDSWVPNLSGPCNGYKATQRLTIKYGDWSFAVKDIKYGKSYPTSLRPEYVDEGVLDNHSSVPTKRTVTRSETVTRSVTHSVTSDWRKSTGASFTISYTPPGDLGGVGAESTFQFGFENGQSTTDEKGEEDTKTLTTSSEVEIPKMSAVKWRLLMFKTRNTVSYRATIIARYSVEFQGFLRWGGGPNGAGTNYHKNHRGSGARPTVNYKFGSSSIPFYEHLKRLSSRNEYPWLWSDMRMAHPNVQSTINYLTNENLYEFTLTGKFDDVMGNKIHLQFKDTPLSTSLWEGDDWKRDAEKIIEVSDSPELVDLGNDTIVAYEGPDDEPSQDLPPEVNIPEVTEVELELQKSISGEPNQKDSDFDIHESIERDDDEDDADDADDADEE